MFALINICNLQQVGKKTGVFISRFYITATNFFCCQLYVYDAEEIEDLNIYCMYVFISSLVLLFVCRHTMFKKIFGVCSSWYKRNLNHGHILDKHFQKHLFPQFSRQFHRRNKILTESRKVSEKASYKYPWHRYALGLGIAGSFALVLNRCSKQTDESRPAILSVSAASPPDSAKTKQGSENPRIKYNFIADVVENVSPAVVFIQNR